MLLYLLLVAKFCDHFSLYNTEPNLILSLGLEKSWYESDLESIKPNLHLKYYFCHKYMV